jgi:hypothetical protein
VEVRQQQRINDVQPAALAPCNTTTVSFVVLPHSHAKVLIWKHEPDPSADFLLLQVAIRFAAMRPPRMTGRRWQVDSRSARFIFQESKTEHAQV